MKLKELAIEGGPLNTNRSLQLGRFSDGLTIVYGENGSGKSTVGRFIRDRLLQAAGQHVVTDSAIALPLKGRISVLDGSRELQFDSGRSASTDVQFGHRFNAELYDSIFNVGFRETQSSLIRLAGALQRQLGVPVGPGAAGDDSQAANRQRQLTTLSQQLESLSHRIATLSNQKNDAVSQLESGRLSRQSQITEIESRIGQINLRIQELRASAPNSQLSAIELEIMRLRTVVSAPPQQVVYESVQATVAGPELLYHRLDDVDDQIRQWRRLQAEIQDQRVRLRDEMLVWNELTLDSNEHPYHDARAILVALESKVEEAERNAALWREADIERVDATKLSQSLDQICNRIREDLHGLCNELSQQYKHIRHRTAAAELRRLRRYYTQMGENIDRLLEQRQILIREIRNVDPAGADAIINADGRFCELAQREGHFAARRRFIGEFTQSLKTPTYQTPDLTAEHARLGLLEQQRNHIASSQSQLDQELNSLNGQMAELTRQRDLLLGQFGFAELESKIQTLELELKPLQIESTSLRRQIEELNQFAPTQPNGLIQRACEIIGQLSDGDLTQVFLSQPPVGRHSEIQVRDRMGKVLNASGVEAGLQDQVYLSLVLAAVEQLQSDGISMPIVIDDAFSRIPPARVNRTLSVLDDHGAAGKQIIALTQHRYLSDRVGGIAQIEIDSTRMELPPPIPASPISTPERRSSPMPFIVPPVIPNNAPRQQATWQPAPPATAAINSAALPYPLSKYSREPLQADGRGYTVAYPGPTAPIGLREDYATSASTTRRQPPTAKPLPVQQFADHLGYVTSISESTLLRKVGFFDAEQLRNFDASNVVTVGDLMVLSQSQSGALGVHQEQLLRWQDQLVLLTTVPGMRNKDARILVACGVTEPEQLDTLHPQQLFERVERFLGTTEGRRFASNSDSISIEHIGGWYRALDATRSSWQNRRSRSNRQSESDSISRYSGQRSNVNSTRPSNRSQRERTSDDRGPRSSRANHSDSRSSRSSYQSENRQRQRLPRVYSRDNRDSQASDVNRSRDRREPRPESRPERRPAIARNEPRVHDARTRAQRTRETTDQVREPREARSPRMNVRTTERNIAPRVAPVDLSKSNLANSGHPDVVEAARSKPAKKADDLKLKFYLDLNDHIEAAPSIGPKSAERFEKIGIYTVADFLKQTAESISSKLNYKRMSAQVIRDWQHQARLVCRIPNLRGHDAQLLVACEFTEPEEISTMQPTSLFATIGPFSETKEGLKIIRNGKKPDLAEITDWITWAGHTRSIKAA